jgi:putative phosphoribosyl transferase
MTNHDMIAASESLSGLEKDHLGQRDEPARPASEINGRPQAIGAVILPVSVAGGLSSASLRQVAAGLQAKRFATVLTELLSPTEMEHGYHNFDVDLLARRISEATNRLRAEAPFERMPIGYFGTSADAAAIIAMAAQARSPARALVMYDARCDLAHTALPLVRAPTLFIVEDDEFAVHLGRSALAQMHCPRKMIILGGASKHLASPEMSTRVAELAGYWFKTHLADC